MAIRVTARASQAAPARQPVVTLRRLPPDGKRCRGSLTYAVTADGAASVACFASDARAYDHYARMGYSVRFA